MSAAQLNAFVDGPFGSNLKTEHYTTNREVRIIQLNNIGDFIWRNTGIKYTTFEHAESLDRCKTYPNDIVIAKMMPAGRAIIVPSVESIYVISSDCVRLSVADSINNKYIMFAINSPVVNAQVQYSVHGIGRSRTSLSKCKELLIPIPPVREQILICESIETVFSLLITVETSREELSIAINSLKSKILDLAIHGELIPQNPDDEPASVLLERIRAEKEELIKQGKIKRDKKESVIFKGEDNSYYDVIIPQSWEITNLSDVTLNISDGSHNPPPKKNKGVPLLSATNIYDNKINYTSATRWITEDEWIIENARTKIEVGDVLITIVGTIGRTAVVSDTTRFALQRSVAVMKPNMIDSKYLMYVLQAPMIIDWLNANAKGNAQVGIYLKDLAKLSFPLPPLAEQKRIVEAIETVFAQLDAILNSIS